MKSNKHKIALLTVIIIAAIIGLIILYKFENPEIVKSKNSKIDNAFYQSLNYSDFDIENIKIDEFTQEEENEIIEKNNVNDKLKLYIIRGIQEKLNYNTEISEEYFQKAMDLLPKIKNNLLKIVTYYEYSESIFYENSELSKEYYDKAVELAQEKRYEDTLLWLKFSRGALMVSSENPLYLDESFEILNEALDLAKKDNNVDKIVRTYYYLGVIYLNKGQQVLSVSNKIEAFDRLDKDDPDNSYYCDFLSTEIGIDYLELENYNAAIQYLSLILEQENFYEGVYFNKAYSAANLCDAYLKIGNIEGAEESYKNLCKYAYQVENDELRKDTIIIINYYKAEIELMKGNLKEAQKSFQSFLNNWEPEAESFAYMNYDINAEIMKGKIKAALGEYDEAIKYHLQAEKLAQDSGSSYYKQQVNSLLIEDYEQTGDYQKAFEYTEKNNIIQEYNRNDYDNQYSKYLSDKFEYHKKEQTISHLEQSNYIAKLLFIFFVAVIISNILFIIIIIGKNKSIKKLSEKFKKLSIKDPLTNIFNRRALNEYMLEEWPKLKLHNESVTFIMLDIDYFKKYNDNYGHPEGDEVLKKAAKCMRDSCRDTDFVARYGGEEFIMLLREIHPHNAEMVIERLRENLKKLNIEHKYSDVSDRVTLSIGMATVQCKSLENYEQGIALADNALYKAKEKRNSYVHIYKNNGFEEMIEKIKQEEKK